MKEPIRTDRTFRVWDYRVSHDQLLLRSPKDAGMRNMDVIFVGVEYLSLPSQLNGLEISPGTAHEILLAEQGCGKQLSAEHVFSVRTKAGKHVVAAASVRVFENDLDLFESSLESFAA